MRVISGLTLALFWFFLSAVSPTRAADFEGFDLPNRVVVFDKPLEISGCGMREIMWTDVYLLSIYMPPKNLGIISLRDPETPKAIRLEIVYDGSIPDELPEDWKAHLREEISRDMLGTLRELYADIQMNDEVLFGYHPDVGNFVRLNGERVAFRENGNLVDALLELWVGPDAVSKNLRRLLLNGSC